MKITIKRPKATAVFTDENGYFSFTGSIGGSSGACGDTIAKLYPELQPLADLHLCSVGEGKPMHALTYTSMKEERATHKSINYAEIDQDSPYDISIKGYQRVVKEVEAVWKSRVTSITSYIETLDLDTTESYCEDADGEYLDNVVALAKYLDCSPDEIDVSSYDDNLLDAQGMEFLVVDDDEAERLWEESLDNYLEECVLPELPESMSIYFDDEAWKRDARMDGRGHSLSGYDGDENYMEEFFIYRTS